MNVRLLEPAESELDEAIAWYAENALGLGEAFLIEVLKTIKLIEDFPQALPHPSLTTNSTAAHTAATCAAMHCSGVARGLSG